MPQAQPELKKVRKTHKTQRTSYKPNFPLIQYLDKRLFVQLNGSRKVIGVLRGYDVRFYCPRPGRQCTVLEHWETGAASRSLPIVWTTRLTLVTLYRYS